MNGMERVEDAAPPLAPPSRLPPSTGSSRASFSSTGVRQSSPRMPPVSPELGFHDQNSQLAPVSAR